LNSPVLLLSAEEKERFHKKICGHYLQYGRDLPWRKTRDGYRIFVSEVMLQQTQVERVMGKYEDFIYLFPSFAALADSSLKDVLFAWQGLGYNRRALSMVGAARKVVTHHDAALPRTIGDLAALPGIGKATAAAILCFAFDEPVPFIETNIRRVFIDHFFQGTGPVKDNEILPLIEETLDRDAPREWFYALMDYGSMLGKKSGNANRKSAHYRKQSPFANSDRRVRGAVLKLLLTEDSVSSADIGARTGVSAERVLPILRCMEREGLVKETEGTYMINDGEKMNSPSISIAPS
jgi:A/G-specific adenine glycosylase